jgi:hypothetical protein
VPSRGAAAIAEELAADLEAVADRDSATVSAAEWQRAMDAHTGLIALGIAERRGRLD